MISAEDNLKDACSTKEKMHKEFTEGVIELIRKFADRVESGEVTILSTGITPLAETRTIYFDYKENEMHFE